MRTTRLTSPSSLGQLTFKGAWQRLIVMLLTVMLTATTAWAQSNEPPTGQLLECYGGVGFIYVEGWAADQDHAYLDYSIRVDVYVYTDEACTSRYGSIVTLTADDPITFAGASPYKKYDGNHGFNTKIWVNDPGNYWVKVIAIDISDSKTQLGDVTAVTVSPVSHSITIANPAEGGTVESSVSSSILDQTITLTATPADGYVLTGITVTYGDNSTVPVTDGLWYTGNTASFTMPNADVTVIPTFAYRPTDLSVNMPVTDTRVINVPPCVTTFKVYDDGGSDGDYSNYCGGLLKVNAPDGKVIQFTGTVTTDNSGYDALSVYNSDDYYYPLIEHFYSNITGVAVSIPTKVSSSNSATIYFGSNTTDCAAGLDLTLTILPAPTGTTDLSQCTASVPTHILWDNLNRDSYIDRSIFVTDPNGVTLTRNIDYELSIELENGETVPINYRYPDPNDPYGACYLRPGVLYNETLIITAIGSYTGTLRVPYKKFRISLDGKTNMFLINSTRDLEYLAAAVNSGLDVKSYANGFIIGNDLAYDPSELTVDLDGDGTPDSNYTPIGTAEHPFVGVFYGNGQTYHWRTDEERAADPHCPNYMPDPLTERTVSGIRCTTKNAPAGLFGCIGSEAVVSDVTLDNCTFTASGTGAAGAIAATVANGATVERCLVKGSTVSGSTKGAIVATNSGTLSRNYYTGCNSNASNIGTAAGDVNGARLDVGLTVPGSLSLAEGTADGLAFDGSFYGGAGETLTFYEDTFDAYTTTGPVASFTHDAENYQYTLAINNDATAAITINHANHFGTDAGADGSEEHPYVISTTGGLDFLAELVNGDPYMDSSSDTFDFYNSRYKFNDKFFKLGGNIEYNPAALTFDLDDDGTEDSNYKPIGIGRADQYGNLQGGDGMFFGTFDGDGHTISGIRINYPNGVGLGIFGRFGSTANYGNGTQYVGLLKNLTVSNTNINGHGSLGGIVASFGGLAITNCHVTNTVSIHANGQEDFEGERAGGIVGVMNGGIVSYGPEVNTISYCTSAVTITAENNDYSGGFGGIVAYMNPIRCTLSHNIVDGATLSGKERYGLGAILGSCLSNYVRDYSFDHNYYHNCTINGETNATGRGYSTTSASAHYVYSYAADITENDGIVLGFALFDDGDNSKAVALAAAAGGSIDVKLVDRKLWKDGNWNTLCLPFDVTIEGSVLDGADVRALDTNATGYDHATGLDDGTLYLNFTAEGAVTEIKAGTPYIIKWPAATPDNIENPVFQGVTVKNGLNDVTFTGGAFKGTYKKITYTEENKSILFLGADNTLYWPQPSGDTNPSIGACRAYFELGGGQQARDFVLNFDDDHTTKIVDNKRETITNNQWYTLDGRKLNNKPMTKGLYIHNGHKVVIK